MRIQVVAGILRDSSGRVLLAERRNDPAFNGLWEFPGGKVDAGEMPGAALVRELREELGITASAFQLLHSVDHDYADRLVHIDFFLVTEWEPEVRPLDGQGLRWLAPGEIRKGEILPADWVVVDLLLYADLSGAFDSCLKGDSHCR